MAINARNAAPSCVSAADTCMSSMVWMAFQAAFPVTYVGIEMNATPTIRARLACLTWSLFPKNETM